MSAPLPDRGLRAVRRVREARERDSRIGLQQALAATRHREAEAALARTRLAEEPAFEAGSADEFRAYSLLVHALAEAVGEKEEEVRRSTSVAEEARRRWGTDRQAVRTVELLLERRAEERRRERARREAAELDELAGQGWLRDHLAATAALPAVPPALPASATAALPAVPPALPASRSVVSASRPGIARKPGPR
jgi:flagellar export protein FliJ